MIAAMCLDAMGRDFFWANAADCDEAANMRDG